MGDSLNSVTDISTQQVAALSSWGRFSLIILVVESKVYYICRKLVGRHVIPKPTATY